MEGSSSLCSVGSVLGEECTSAFKAWNVLTEEEQELILWRSKLQSLPQDNANVCSKHTDRYLRRFSLHQRHCCDIFNIHKRPIKSGLHEITLKEATDLRNKGIAVIPGEKLCISCRKRLSKVCNTAAVAESSSSSPPLSASEEISESADLSPESPQKLNTSLVSLGISPVKLHSVPRHRRSVVAKRKFQSAAGALKTKIAKVYGTGTEQQNEHKPIEDNVQKKAQYFDELMKQIKEKMKHVKYSEKVQLLTLVPESWPREKVSKMFGVSEYMVRQARALLAKKGILAQPEGRTGKMLSEETMKKVTDFYVDDENSRIMPGKKDKISISKNVYKQKRLVLSNLSELYSSFKATFPQYKIGFSKFAVLRPKECVLAGSSGTHAICVCTTHQNVQLLLQSININETYQDLIKLITCDTNSRACMLRLCENCPSNLCLKEHIQQQFLDAFDPDEPIQYKQWVATDRVNMVTEVCSFSEFCDLLTQKLEKLIPHSLTAKSQSSYLKALKESLDDELALILLDFSENYSFVIQDEAQGYHWNTGSCTLHAAVVYYKKDEILHSKCFCLISDDTDHDVPFVYQSQKIIINFMKTELSLSHIKAVEYFSDGCAAQYKNRKNFINMCHHEVEFGIKCRWSFFATSHGKSPCDGIGGTIKRILTKASLQRPFKDQITSATQVFQFCTQNIKEITTFFVTKEELVQVRKYLNDRFENAKTIPGTRSMHQFVPLSMSKIGAKQLSSDSQYSVIFDMYKPAESPNFKNNSYVACVYDSLWYVGFIDKLHSEEGDATIRFMHPHGPSPSFYWPDKDSCEVPFAQILCEVDIKTTTGRTYTLSKESLEKIQAKLTKLL